MFEILLEYCFEPSNYWGDEINSYTTQWFKGPDAIHDWWKWDNLLKTARIMKAENKTIKEIQSWTL